MFSRLFGTKKRGDEAERLAENFLIEHGLRCIARNFRTRFGEIDLIMQDGPTLVFVEVRLRQQAGKNDFGGPAASITSRKQARIIAAAQLYIANKKNVPPCRFDAVLLNQLAASEIEWMKDAFSA